MGIIGAALAGGFEGAGAGGASVGKEWTQALHNEARDKANALEQQNLARLTSQLAQETHAVNTRTDINAIPEKGAAETGVLVGRQSALLPGQVASKTALAAVDTQQKVDEFTRLEPLKRQAAIDTAVEQLKALSTPEMLKASRDVALSKHIVDPQFTLIPNADGTVTTFDVHSGKSTGPVNGPDGKPIQRKDPEELKAATSVINMANTNLRIAQAEHKAAMSDISLDAAGKASANAAWQAAQDDARRLTGPAYAVLYGKAGVKDSQPAAAKPDPASSQMNYGFVNPKTGYKWIGRPGDKVDDPNNWEAPKPGGAPAKSSGLVERAVPEVAARAAGSGVDPNAPVPAAWRKILKAKESADAEAAPGEIPGAVDIVKRALR